MELVAGFRSALNRKSLFRRGFVVANWIFSTPQQAVNIHEKFTNIHEYSTNIHLKYSRRITKRLQNWLYHRFDLQCYDGFGRISTDRLNIHWIFTKWPILEREFSLNIPEYSGSWIFGLGIFSSLIFWTGFIHIGKRCELRHLKY